jgi:hypothetical protein
MKNTKHTPGPWIKQGMGIVNSPVTGSAMATSRIETTLGNIEILDETNEPDYNLSLILSAPDLLEALEMAVATIERLKPSGGTFDSTQGTKDVCRQAIAKAKGEL